jgi:hypothetical protein
MRTTAHPTVSLQALNTLVLAGIMLWFVAQQNLLTPSAIKYGPTDVAKAMHFLPRTPPPMAQRLRHTLASQGCCSIGRPDGR